MNLLIVVLGLSCIYQVSSSPTKNNNLENELDIRLRQILVEKIIEKLKAADLDISNLIDSSVNHGLDMVGSIHHSCKQDAQVKLQQIREDFQAELSNCSIYRSVHDQLNLVKADIDLTVKTIVGNAIGDIVHLGDCIESDNPFTCLSTVWFPLIAEDIAGDIHVSADTIFQILKLAFEGSQAVWVCIQGSMLDQQILTVVSEAFNCHNQYS